MPLHISPNVEFFDASNFVLHQIFGQTAWSALVTKEEARLLLFYSNTADTAIIWELMS